MNELSILGIFGGILGIIVSLGGVGLFIWRRRWSGKSCHRHLKDQKTACACPSWLDDSSTVSALTQVSLVEDKSADHAPERPS